jgi:hypothetical protein
MAVPFLRNMKMSQHEITQPLERRLPRMFGGLIFANK